MSGHCLKQYSSIIQTIKLEFSHTIFLYILAYKTPVKSSIVRIIELQQLYRKIRSLRTLGEKIVHHPEKENCYRNNYCDISQRSETITSQTETCK